MKKTQLHILASLESTQHHVKCNVHAITHTVTDKIIKMLKSTMDKVQTELDHSENSTHSGTASGLQN